MTDTARPAGRGYESIRPDALDRARRYKLFTGSVIPRPIALVTSLGETGVVNAAPFSQFVIVAVDPGLLGFSIGPGPRGHKDTLRNVTREREFVINTVPWALAAIVQHCGEDVAPEVSEIEMTGLEVLASERVRAPRVAASKVQFECTLERIVEVGDAPNHFVIGRVVLVHLEEGLQTDFKIDPRRYDPLARIGGRTFARLGEIVSV
jgi:flavin reductase (DIM6/NTAB) family NADH-FMN oxidoreductase RutF